MKRIVGSLFAVSLLMAGALFAQDAAPASAPAADAVTAPAAPAAVATPAAAPAAGKTMANLLTAFNGESNAQERYTAFAKKADEEGFLGVGSLFRAVAKSEGIHVAHLKAEIEKQGGKAEAKIEAPEVKSTKENLEAAMNGENAEKDTMYPEFKATAEKENQEKAIILFGGSAKVEAAHAALYAEALKNLDAYKTAKKDFFVCTICGYTTATAPTDKCPVCTAPKDKFETVN